jgi:tRNA A-37 threonylcarbamoyl transferase component Bud32
MKTCPVCHSSYPNHFSLCPRDGAPLVEMGAWMEGTVIRGKYRILGKVGQGGMGAVYKAHHMMFDELRALKVMNPEILGDELFIKRFKQEAVIARKLDHPNAVRVDDIDEAEDGRPYIVMEYIEGDSLKALIKEHGPLPVGRTCSIVKQVASALDAAHRLGMVHRDIKPANIVLIETPEGEVAKVLDFGIAKFREAQPTEGLTLTGTGILIGTPQYMSPEQASGRKSDEIDGRSDLYSLGVVMYQMLTGELPFKADTTMELLLAHINAPPRPLLEARPDLQISPATAAVVMKCLEKKPEARPADGAALIEELDRALGEGTEGGAATQTFAGGISAQASKERANEADTGSIAGAVRPDTPAAKLGGTARTLATGQVRAQPPIAAARGPSAGLRWAVWLLSLIIVAGGGFAYWHYRTEHQNPAQSNAAAPPAPNSPGTSAVNRGSPGGEPGADEASGAASGTETVSPLPETGSTAARGGSAKAATPQLSNPLSSAKLWQKGAVRPELVNGGGRSTAETARVASPNLPAVRSESGAPGGAGAVTSASAFQTAGGPSGSFVLATSPGTEVFVDGVMAGTVGPDGHLTVKGVAAGAHKLRLEGGGFNGFEYPVRIPVGATVFVTAQARQNEASQPAAGPQAAPGAAATNQSAQGSQNVETFQVTHFHRFGSCHGPLIIGNGRIQFVASNSKDSFQAPLTAITYGTRPGIFYVHLQDGRTFEFHTQTPSAITLAIQQALRSH